MRVRAIPDSLIPDTHSRIICTDNANLDDIRPVEAMIGPTVSNVGAVAEISVLVELEAEDLEAIEGGGRNFWMVVSGIALPPFGLTGVLKMEDEQLCLPF